VKCFSRALHLNPADDELRNDDLFWAVELLQKKAAADRLQRKAEQDDKIKIVELDTTEINESGDMQVGETASKKTLPATSTPVVDRVKTVNFRKPPSHFVCMRN